MFMYFRFLDSLALNRGVTANIEHKHLEGWFLLDPGQRVVDLEEALMATEIKDIDVVEEKEKDLLEDPSSENPTNSFPKEHEDHGEEETLTDRVNLYTTRFQHT
jgi:hypothetical protein